jgi:mannose-1-phosphate guanylyltransferase
MRALLLAAGYGTRLRPITDFVPKCLVPIKGKPLLQIWLENLTDAGIGPFLVNTHYLSEQVFSFVHQSKFSSMITLSYEPILLGTGGTMLYNHTFFENEDGLLIHADNYCLTDFKKFIEFHQNRPSGCVMTLMSFKTLQPNACGILEVDENNILVKFHEKVSNPPGNLANGAVYIMTPEVIKWMIQNKATDITRDVIPNFIGRIFTFENTNIHIDIGSTSEFARAQNI